MYAFPLGVVSTGMLTGISVVGQADPIAMGGSLGQMTASAILGVVCVVCIYMLKQVYKDKQEEQKEYMAQLVTALNNNAAVNLQVLEAMRKCQKPSGA